MDEKSESDLVLALLSTASYILSPHVNSPVHDEQTEVVDSYRDLKTFMSSIAAGYLTLEAAKYLSEQREFKNRGLEKPKTTLREITSALLNEQGYIRNLLHSDPFFHQS